MESFHNESLKVFSLKQRGGSIHSLVLYPLPAAAAVVE